MLTGKLVRVRTVKDRLIPGYINPEAPEHRTLAERLIGLFQTFPGRTREEIEEELTETLGSNPSQLVAQGLAKLLEDRSEFEVESLVDPAVAREEAFRRAAAVRRSGASFDRQKILEEAAATLGCELSSLERSLFADLRGEQRLVSFEECTAEQLLHRYNVALAQAVLLRSTGVTIDLPGESPGRMRQLLRKIKFHRLIAEFHQAPGGGTRIQLDGPLSLFSSTTKYGIQLANLLPSLLLCQRFELTARVRWGAARREVRFQLSHTDALRSHLVDSADYLPPELTMFAESFQKSIADWELSESGEILPLANTHWVPDFVLRHRPTGGVVYLEVLGFWRKASVEELFARLQKELREPFLLAVSDQFNIDESLEGEWGGHLYRFKRSLLPSEVARLAEQLLKSQVKTSRSVKSRS